MKKLMMVAVLMMSLAAVAQEGYVARKTILEVEVSVAGGSASVGDAGNFLVTGYIYPAGTLSHSSGINEDGTAEFPDEVIGRWICQGWFSPVRVTADGVPLGAVTTQSFELDLDSAGNDLFVTYGFEQAGLGTVTRTVTGGTGEFVGLDAVQEQTLFGLNASGQPNYSTKIVVESVINFKNHLTAQEAQ